MAYGYELILLTVGTIANLYLVWRSEKTRRPRQERRTPAAGANGRGRGGFTSRGRLIGSYHRRPGRR